MGERGLKTTSFFKSIASHSPQSGRKPWQNCPNFWGCPGRILYLVQSHYSATDYKMVSDLLETYTRTHTYTCAKNTFLFLFIRHQIDTDREWILGKNLEETWTPPVELLESKGFITTTFCFPTKCLWKPSSWPFASWLSTKRNLVSQWRFKQECWIANILSTSLCLSRAADVDLSRASLKRPWENPAMSCPLCHVPAPEVSRACLLLLWSQGGLWMKKGSTPGVQEHP